MKYTDKTPTIKPMAEPTTEPEVEVDVRDETEVGVDDKLVFGHEPEAGAHTPLTKWCTNLSLESPDSKTMLFSGVVMKKPPTVRCSSMFDLEGFYGGDQIKTSTLSSHKSISYPDVSVTFSCIMHFSREEEFDVSQLTPEKLLMTPGDTHTMICKFCIFSNMCMGRWKNYAVVFRNLSPMNEIYSAKFYQQQADMGDGMGTGMGDGARWTIKKEFIEPSEGSDLKLDLREVARLFWPAGTKIYFTI